MSSLAGEGCGQPCYLELSSCSNLQGPELFLDYLKINCPACGTLPDELPDLLFISVLSST